MTIDMAALARECGFEFYPDADGNIDDDLFTGWRHELIAFGNAIIERCADKCDKLAHDFDRRSDRQGQCEGAVLCVNTIRSMKAPTP